MADYYTLLTNAGIAYETACKAAGVPIKLSQISVGDGGGAVYNPAATATALKREVWRGPLNALFQDEKNPSWLLAEVTIPPQEGGWYVREAGLWTDTGILYAIVKYPESFKPVLATSGSGKEFYIRSIFETSNASLVTLLIDDTVVKATRAWVMGYLADELASTRAEIEAMIAQASALPVGSMVAFPKATVPPGFLEVDGSVQSIATYPDLYAFLGTTFNTGGEGAGNFRLPESRGEFLRGWDHGRGVDIGRDVGSWQKGSLQAFDYSSESPAVSGLWHTGPDANALGAHGLDAVTTANYPVSHALFGTSTQSAQNVGLGATRPRNLSVMWCIKAWSAPINPGNIDVAALEAQVLTLNNKLSQLFKTPTDVKASRAINVTYTNSSTLPIVVNVALVGTAANQTATVIVDGVSIFGSSFPNTGLSLAVSAIIPAGSTYRVPTGSYTISNWVEIR